MHAWLAGSDPQTSARPTAITVTCVLGSLVVGVAVARIVARWDVFHTLPGLRVAGTIAALGATVIALLGFWWMKRWALWLLAGALLARVLAGIVGGLTLRPTDLIWPSVLLLIGLLYGRRMR